MKKMIMVLMMAFTMMTGLISCATTSPVDTSVVINVGDWTIVTNSDNKPLNYLDGYPDSKKVEICEALAPEEINGKHLIYDGFEFHEASWITKEYYTYIFVKKDETYMVWVINTGDGRELRLYYHLKDGE